MKAKHIITAILLVFVAVSIVYLILNELRPGGGEPAADAAVDGSAGAVVVYYFHGDKRCRTCISIEAYTREAIEEGFLEQLESGELELRIVNVDDPENGHFIQDYGLTTKSVILADVRGGAEGRWKNLDMIWEYVGDKKTFLDYVQRETAEFLGGATHE